MSALALLFVCMGLGVLAARFGGLPSGTAHAINWWVLDAALPALVLVLVPHLRFEGGSWFLVVAMWIVFGGAWALFTALGRAARWSRERVGALTLVAGLGNTSFIGYPMIEALHGKPGLTLAVVSDQLGSFPLLAAGGVAVAAIHSGRTASAGAVVFRVLTFPAFIALVVGLGVGALGGWPASFESLLLQIGQTLSPLALFSVGLQLRVQGDRDQLGALCAGLGWKLVLAPLLCWAIGRAGHVHGLTMTVGVLEAAMAPMISAAILADQYGLEPRLTNALLGLGIAISLVTVPLVDRWLR
jgi:predicted permease